MTPLEHADFLADQFYHHVFEDGSDGADHIEPIRQALAASQPPSGDAPDLREALGMCVEALYGRESVSDAIEAARAALAASAPSSPATPAPLDGARLARLIDPDFDSRPSYQRDKAIDEGWRVARAYANQEGGEPRKED